LDNEGIVTMLALQKINSLLSSRKIQQVILSDPNDLTYYIETNFVNFRMMLAEVYESYPDHRVCSWNSRTSSFKLNPKNSNTHKRLSWRKIETPKTLYRPYRVFTDDTVLSYFQNQYCDSLQLVTELSESFIFADAKKTIVLNPVKTSQGSLKKSRPATPNPEKSTSDLQNKQMMTIATASEKQINETEFQQNSIFPKVKNDASPMRTKGDSSTERTRTQTPQSLLFNGPAGTEKSKSPLNRSIPSGRKFEPIVKTTSNKDSLNESMNDDRDSLNVSMNAESTIASEKDASNEFAPRTNAGNLNK